MSDNKGMIGVDVNGMRHCIWNACRIVISNTKSVLEKFNDCQYVTIDRDDIVSLAKSVNDLKNEIVTLMCLVSPEKGWDNLTHLLPQVPYIDIRENEDEE